MQLEVTRLFLAALMAAACGGATAGQDGAQSASSTSSGDPSRFDCEAHATSPEFEGLDPDIREHLLSMCKLETELTQYAADRRSCESDDDCTVLETSCHLGCSIAVAASEREAVAKKQAELEQRVGGDDCTGACDSARGVACVDGACAIR